MGIGIDNSKPDSYELEILTLVNNEGEGFDIRELLVECAISESIRTNFLMGTLVIGDSINLLENAKLFGQESLRIRFSQPSGVNDETHEDDLIDQVFRVYKVDDVYRADETTQFYKLYFTANEFLESRRTRISQAFRGSMTDIAAKIAEDKLDIKNKALNKKLESYFEVREKSQGDQYHVIIPNWSTNYTINWLCSQAQGIDDSSGLQDSFYWYQTANGGYRIQSLASMMELEYAGGRPFSYIEANANEGKDSPSDKTGEDADSTGMGRRILSYQVESHADVLKATVEGMFASRQTTVDNTYKFFIDKTYDFLEKHFSGGSSIEEHPFVRTTPEMLHIGGSSDGEEVAIQGVTEENAISSYSDAHYILASDSSFKFDDKNKIHHADHQTHLGSNQLRNAAMQLLEYYTLNLVISGRTDISVGKLINLDIPSIRPGESESSDPTFYNGKHLITEIMWNLQPRELTVNIKCMKDSVINNIETTAIKYGDSEES